MKIQKASVLLFILIPLSAWTADSSSLNLVKTIPLPGVKGRFDHFSIDAKGRRLFVAALGNSSVEIVDVEAGKHLKSVDGVQKPTGLLYVPEKNCLAVADGTGSALKVFDGRSFDLQSTIRSLDDADNVRYDAAFRRIYVGYGEGVIAVIDAASLQQTGVFKLNAHPESFQLEQNGPRMFVNAPGSKKVVVIDRQKRSTIASWPLTEATENFPMAIDEARKRLLIGCRQPPRLLVLDTTSGKTTSSLSICGDTDDLFYDARRKRLYVSCGEGFMDVIDQLDADHYKLRERISTREGARTSFYSSELDSFYLAVPQRNGQEAEIRVYQPK
jgi:DNA-binding beta-propeller fold protein YncE